MELLIAGAGLFRNIRVDNPAVSKLGHRPRRRGGICVLVRVIAGPYHRTRLNMAESETKCFVPQINELLRRVKPGDRQMIFRGTQVLSNRKDIDSASPEIAKHFD